MKMNLDFGIHGKVKATVTDIRDGSKQVVKQDNLILNSLMNSWFTSNRILISEATMHMCYLGTSSAPPSPTDTGVQGTVLASSSAGTTLHIDGPRAELPDLSALPGTGNGCSFSPDGKYLAVGHYESPYITVYDVENDFEKLPALSPLPGQGHSCAFSPDGKYLAVAHANSPYITVYDVENNFTKLPALLALPGVGFGCSFSPDGEYLAVAHGESQYITVYDTNTKYATQRSIVRRWVFPPGTGTGEIGELVLRTTTTNVWASRIAFELPIVKTEFHELEVEWQMTVSAEPLTTNTIQNGQIDGSTNVTCTFEYLPHMLHNIAMSNGHAPWFGITGTPALALGDGAGTYDFGEGNGILGTQFARYATSAIRIVNPYVANSLERTFRLFLETNQGNELPISEMAMEGFGRIRFDPPLEKVDTHRLYVDVSLSFSREGE